MKKLLSFGVVHILSSDNVEIIMDSKSPLTLGDMLELDEVLSSQVNKPYSLLLNLINNTNVSSNCLKYFYNYADIACVAVLEYFSNDKLKLPVTQPNVRFFDGLVMGRSQAISWLELHLSKLTNAAQ